MPTVTDHPSVLSDEMLARFATRAPTYDRENRFFVAELGFRAGRWPGTGPAPAGATGGLVSVFDADGNLLTRWGGGDNPCAPGDFFAPHSIWVDHSVAVYVSEVTLSAGGRAGVVPVTCHTLQKFVPT